MHIHMLLCNIHRFFSKADGVIVVYDITNHRSYESVRGWLQDVIRYADPNTVITLVGNKCDDLKCREVPTEEAMEFASE